ncbi:ARPP-2 domain-containing protein [Actinomadura rudentiformis]|uniref:ARG and Rhodanese-Phosphatase-superfamily-associated domain-containing protein n=1 Tax=Actinomadura rudentiformis TaxID=359158 RepID=A0A6H9YWG9_9ACTN|nr:hypothetical protein [Actinomadura rudentiformis]KAB2346792.1 hypothetical protein F8566_21420 [Actinomadura rudentiformis]
MSWLEPVRWMERSGLRTGPAQAWGSVRLVPLVRDEPVPHLRLDRRVYADEPSVVDVGDGTHYISYIPHAFVARWDDGEAPAAAYGTQMRDKAKLEKAKLEKDDRGIVPSMPIRVRRRMARRVTKDRLRFLPLHVAVEGYLALHFGGPEIAWSEWSRRALANGLSPRSEEAYTGAQVRGLADALRIFEIHPGQCGVLVYVADALASAFVVPHPDDYRALHPTLVEDLFGELVYQYGFLTLHVPDLGGRVDDTAVRSLVELRAEATRLQRDWADFHDGVMAGNLFQENESHATVQHLHGFELTRSLPPFNLRGENHIRESIIDGNGRIAYLKSFRLSEAQVRRGYLLTRLAAHDWSLEATAEALGATKGDLALRLERAGFGYLLRQDVLDHYRAQARRAVSGGGR